MDVFLCKLTYICYQLVKYGLDINCVTNKYGFKFLTTKSIKLTYILPVSSQRCNSWEHIFPDHIFVWISKKNRGNKRFKLVTFVSCGVIIIL